VQARPFGVKAAVISGFSLSSPWLTSGGFMRPSYRSPVNKGKSSRRFSSGVSRTKSINVQPPPMRGGYRL